MTAVRRLPRVNIGCGRALRDPKEGWVNCDLHPGEGVDKVFDCQRRWPFKDQSVQEIQTDHTLEHLDKPLDFFKEAWRVLIPNGKLTMRLPYGWHQSAWWDLTHLRPWVQESFAILQPGFTYYTRNYQHEKMGFAFWVSNCIVIFEKPFARMWRFKPLRPFVKVCGRYLINVYRDIMVEAFKTEEDDKRSAAHGGPHHPAVVPICYGVLEHEYYGRSAEGLDYHKLLIFTDKAKDTATAGCS